MIDDGSHIGGDIISSFGVIWDAVRPGGFYVIEDLGVSYDERWEGGPPGTPGTGADLIKRLVDSTLRTVPDQGVSQPIAATYIYAEIASLKAPAAASP